MLPALINRTCTNPQLNYMRNRWTKWVDTVCCRKYPLAVPLIHNQRASTFQCVSDNIHQHSYYEQPFPLPFIYANTMTNTWWCLTLKIVLRWIQTGHNESLIIENIGIEQLRLPGASDVEFPSKLSPCEIIGPINFISDAASRKTDSFSFANSKSNRIGKRVKFRYIRNRHFHFNLYFVKALRLPLWPDAVKTMKGVASTAMDKKK